MPKLTKESMIKVLEDEIQRDKDSRDWMIAMKRDPNVYVSSFTTLDARINFAVALIERINGAFDA